MSKTEGGLGMYAREEIEKAQKDSDKSTTDIKDEKKP
jgi:hypothetical protein